jgi:amino acid adenylation domain-containing protein
MKIRKISLDKLALAANQNKKERDYWIDKLSGDLQKSNFPFDLKKKNWSTRNKKTVTSRFSEDIFLQLNKLSKGSDHALNVILTAVLVVLLNKYTSAGEIVIGTPIYKQDIETEFINTLLVLRYRFDSDVSIKHILSLAGRTIVEATEHYSYPIELLPEKLGLPNVEGEFPLFDVVVLLRNIHDKSYIQHISSNVVFSFYRTGEYVEVEVEYDSLLYSETTINRIIRHYTNLARSVLFNIYQSLTQVDILSDEEKEQILVGFNNTGRPLPTDKGVHELFEKQVAKTPDHVALIGQSAGSHAPAGESHRLTYAELNEKINRLAVLLREKGIKPDTLIGVLIERSLEMITAIYAVLKAGAAYLPIDPSYPSERVYYMLEDSGSPILLTREKFAKTIASDFKGEIIDACEESVYQGRGGRQNLKKVTTPDNLFYMIYTSGSTGKPKGAMIKNRGFANLMFWFNTEFAIDSRDRFILISPVSFDLTQKNLYSPLLVGGILCLSSPGLPDYQELSNTIVRENVTVFNAAPSVFYPLIDLNSDDRFRSLESLRYLFLGGEPIRVNKLDRWLNAENCHCELVNTYGPTECTDISSSYRVCPEDILANRNIPIGKPIYNVSLFVLDKALQILPIGVMGELCIGGDGVSKGYHKNPQLNSEKFIETPHLPARKIYRTGDMVRWLADGNIEFLGRVDHQVKIRGNRIELGEIESRLSNHPSIKEVVVTAAVDDTGENQLCAYIVFGSSGDEGGKPGIMELRDFLAGELPDYMIPLYFVPIETIPLTPSGKVDRKVLPAPGLISGMPYAAPRDEIDNKLVEIWTEVLFGRDALRKTLFQGTGIGIDDDFFQLGGHSLKGTVLIARIHKTFEVRVTLSELFKFPNIRNVSELIKKGVKDKYFSIEAAEKKEYYELSSAQKRLYIMMQVEHDNTTYNMPIMYHLKLQDDADIDRWTEIFKNLIRRHESFRTSFIMLEEKTVQRIHDPEEIEFEIEYFETGRSMQKKTANVTAGQVLSEMKDLIVDFIRPFDLSKAPLLRVKWIQAKEDPPLLIIDMHHTVSDGISIQLFQKELIALFVTKELSPLRIQYKDFARWHKAEGKNEKIKKQEEYWLQEFTGEIPILELPLDHDRPDIQSFEGNTVEFSADSRQTETLNRLAKAENVTMFMLLLAFYNILLSKLSGQEDIVVGTPAAGRRHADLDKIVGMFINTLTVRAQPSGEKSFLEFLAEIREKTLLAFENQEYQFEELVDRLIKRRDTSRNPIFDVMFVMQNIDREKLKAPGLELIPYEYDLRIAKFDMCLFAVEEEQKLLFYLEYCSKIFKKATIEQFVEYFKEIIKTVLENKDIKLEEINIAHDLFDQQLDNPEIDFSF